MTNRRWNAGAADLERAEEAFTTAAARLDAGAEGIALLEAAGRLVALGARAGVRAWSAARAERARAVTEALAADTFAELEDAAVALRAILDRRAGGAGDVGDDDLAHGVRAALGVRDRVELRTLGAAALLGAAPAPSLEQASALLVFDSLIRPELWRLTEANEARRAALAWMAPPLRPSFWWWHEGADIAPGAVSSLAAVAHLCARFPAAAEALRSLVTAQHAWDEAGSARRAATVTTLGAWLRRRSDEARSLQGSAGLALAAATAGEEITLVDLPAYQISWQPPDSLLVDLVADRAPGALPSLLLADGVVVPAEAVAGVVERFRIPAGAPLLAGGRVVLVLPLASGTVTVPLPPEP